KPRQNHAAAGKSPPAAGERPPPHAKPPRLPRAAAPLRSGLAAGGGTPPSGRAGVASPSRTATPNPLDTGGTAALARFRRGKRDNAYLVLSPWSVVRSSKHYGLRTTDYFC